MLVDALVQFSIIEMLYADKRYAVQNVIERVFKQEFKMINLEVERAVLLKFQKRRKYL
jgi:hypothetical protein